MRSSEPLIETRGNVYLKLAGTSSIGWNTSGCLIICLSVLVIGYSSDIGSALGDTKEHCSTYVGPRWKAAIIYVVGFWVLDFSNNAVQGPARAMMADLSGKHGCSAGNIKYAFWMAFGNILGYSSGASGSWHKWFPFLMTSSCCEACAFHQPLRWLHCRLSRL